MKIHTVGVQEARQTGTTPRRGAGFGLWCGSMVAVMLLSGTVSAADLVLPLQNGGFELPVKAYDSWTWAEDFPTNWIYEHSGNVAWITWYPASSVVLQPVEGHQYFGLYPTAGTWLSASQVLTGYALVPSSVYTLSLWVGQGDPTDPVLGPFPNTTVTLSAGTTVLSTIYIGETSWQPEAQATPGANAGKYYTLVYKAGSTPPLGDLKVTLRADHSNSKGLSCFDDVTLKVKLPPRTSFVPITNWSFENPTLADGGSATERVVPGWTCGGANYGAVIYNPPASALQAVSSANVLNMYVSEDAAWGRTSQKLTGQTLQPSTLYTLSVWVGFSDSWQTEKLPSNLTLTLFAGPTLLAQTFIGQTSWQAAALAPPALGSGQFYTVTYQTGSTPISGDLEIMLRMDHAGGPGYQFNTFDMISLMAVGLPPGTQWILR